MSEVTIVSDTTVSPRTELETSWAIEALINPEEEVSPDETTIIQTENNHELIIKNKEDMNENENSNEIQIEPKVITILKSLVGIDSLKEENGKYEEKENNSPTTIQTEIIPIGMIINPNFNNELEMMDAIEASESEVLIEVSTSTDASMDTNTTTEVLTIVKEEENRIIEPLSQITIEKDMQEEEEAPIITMIKTLIFGEEKVKNDEIIIDENVNIENDSSKAEEVEEEVEVKIDEIEMNENIQNQQSSQIENDIEEPFGYSFRSDLIHDLTIEEWDENIIIITEISNLLMAKQPFKLKDYNYLILIEIQKALLLKYFSEITIEKDENTLQILSVALYKILLKLNGNKNIHKTKYLLLELYDNENNIPHMTELWFAANGTAIGWYEGLLTP